MCLRKCYLATLLILLGEYHTVISNLLTIQDTDCEML